jgi:site-specific DNA-methyltransferase (adenine-specific)
VTKLPKPFYQDDWATIYCADCRDIIPLLPNVDLILTDPPYGINFHSNHTKNHDRIIGDKFDEWIKLLPEMLKLFHTVLSDTGCCCCCCCCGGGKTPVTAIFTMEAIKHFNLIQTLVWRKFIGLGWRYRPAYENIVVLSKDKDNYNFYDTSKSCSNVIEGINQDIPDSEEHPTQKPVPLMAKLINIHSLENHLVLDPFMGSGTTLRAAKDLHRKSIGIEIEEKYCEIAVKRLRQEVLL